MEKKAHESTAEHNIKVNFFPEPGTPNIEYFQSKVTK